VTKRPRPIALSIAGLLTATTVVAQRQATGQPEPAEPTTLGPTPVNPENMSPTPGEPAPIETVHDLLERLRDAKDALETFRATVQYTREFAIAGDSQTRRGELFFDNRSTDDHGRRFAVLFDTLIVGGRLEREQQLFVFDGEWLVEKVPGDRRFTKRQVAPAGTEFDPLRIGEGPFPVPIGQDPEEILTRYDAELRPPGEGIDDDGLRGFAEKSLVQMRLTPKPHRAEIDDFVEIRLWYDPRTEAMLPRIARTENLSGDLSVVVLMLPEPNVELPAEAFDTSTPPRSEGWSVTISPYRSREPGTGVAP
jgi:hypothetical protein